MLTFAARQILLAATAAPKKSLIPIPRHRLLTSCSRQLPFFSADQPVTLPVGLLSFSLGKMGQTAPR